MGPKSERVYRTIHEWVASGKLKPGEKLPSERTLAKELEIGRTQLRTVLAKLVAGKAIESYARSSYRVPSRAVSLERPDDLESWQIHGGGGIWHVNGTTPLPRQNRGGTNKAQASGLLPVTWAFVVLPAGGRGRFRTADICFVSSIPASVLLSRATSAWQG
ncbi:winged helix-turn-helix domain-containing protein [Streptomyces sp. NPDC019890]|uniref:winged helix-turn-helix domain-containing protein n=1 Tax=Streptomyces sp. NPDC019890 TaxID=3365064 RepID=UPI0038510087